MSGDATEIVDFLDEPHCPMCGSRYPDPIVKPRRHEVDCPYCGEAFSVEGNPDIARPEYHRPFWTDQFRPGKENEETPDAVAGIGLPALVIVGVTLVVIVIFAALGQ